MLRTKNRKSSEILSSVPNVRVQNQRSAPLTPPTKLSKSTTNKLTEITPVKIPLISRPNLAINKNDRGRITSMTDQKTKFHKETIALDKHEKAQNVKKISDTMIITKPDNDDPLSRTSSKRHRKNYKKRVDEKKGDSKPSLIHQEESYMNHSRKKEMRNFTKNMQQSAHDLDGEIESYFEVLKNSISELVQEKVNQVFNSCINVMMKRFNEMADHMHHQEERMMKNINQINTKIVHYGEHHSRHFHYLCMKAEYDKLSRQALSGPKKSGILNVASSTQYGNKNSNDGNHCPNCPCTPHINSSTNTYHNCYSTNKINHGENPPSEGLIQISATESNEKPIKLPRGESDSAVNIKPNVTESIAQVLGEQINSNNEISVASLIGEFRKRKLAANNIGLKVPPSSPDGGRSELLNQRKTESHPQNTVSTQSSELGLRDIMDTIKKYYSESEAQKNNQFNDTAINSKTVFDGCGDFNNTEDDEEYSDDYSTSHEDMIRN